MHWLAPSVAYVPGVHATAGVLPLHECPAGQGMEVVPSALDVLPGAQKLQPYWPCSGWYWPAAQVWHALPL